jgi:hypothetical protein
MPGGIPHVVDARKRFFYNKAEVLAWITDGKNARAILKSRKPLPSLERIAAALERIDADLQWLSQARNRRRNNKELR